MKTLLLIISLLVTLPAASHAQTWSEWFRQGRTQRRYDAKALALYKVYLEYVKKGITIVRKGLNTVRNMKEGDFNLHRDFFASLDNVNPRISNSAKVADIIAYQIFINRELSKIAKFCRNHGNFTPEEISYVADVTANMLVLCDANLSELLMIIKSDKTKMTDDARLKRIDSIHEDMLDKRAFVQAFDNEVKFLAHERQREQLQINHLKTQYDL